MKRVLFLSEDNSVAGPMAESFLNTFGRGEFHAESAGVAPKPVHPAVVDAMRELDQDLSGYRSKSAEETPTDYDYVIELSHSRVDLKPPKSETSKMIHWEVNNSSPPNQSKDETLEFIRVLRDHLRRQTKQFVRSFDIIVEES